MDAKELVYVAYPRRPGHAPEDERTGELVAVRPVNERSMYAVRAEASLINLNFNRIWVNALNNRSKMGIDAFAMQHDDIVPCLDWADIELDELHRAGADIMSAVVPIKDKRGLTSTGIRDTVTGSIRRLTMHEIFQLPETFSLADLHSRGIRSGREGSPANEVLVANTGLWVCDFTKHWVEPPIFEPFTCNDVVRRMDDGRFEALALPEDWLFSEWAQKHGLKVFATRKASLGHWSTRKSPEERQLEALITAATAKKKMLSAQGQLLRREEIDYVAGIEERHAALRRKREFRNDHVWGEWKTDQGDTPRV